MKNELFDTESLNIVLSTAKWRIISSLWAEEADFIHDPAHLKWMRTHTERHPAREILLSLKGDGVYGFQGKVYPCQPGSMILFNSYEPHDCTYPATGPKMLHLWLRLFENDVFARVLLIADGKLRTTGTPLAISDSPPAALLTNSWDELMKTSTHPPALRRAKLESALLAVLAQIAESGFVKPEKHSESSFQRQVIETIRRHIAATAGRDVPLAEAARLSGYSKFHFLRLFKQATGQTFHRFVDDCRTKKVKAMLQERRTKTEIAATLGFSHPSTFLRWLKSQGHKF